jgi:hypothetical protein
VCRGRGAAAARLVAVALALPAPSLARAGAGLPFSSRLSALENFYQRRQTDNALASTLGGGAFLCRQLPLAARMAAAQQRVALRLGDARLFARAALHGAYIAIALARWPRAFRALRTLSAHAAASGDDDLARMVGAAATHARKARRLAASGALDAPVAHFARAVTIPALAASAGPAGGGGAEADAGAERAMAMYERDARHYDELHRLRPTVGPR